MSVLAKTAKEYPIRCKKVRLEPFDGGAGSARTFGIRPYGPPRRRKWRSLRLLMRSSGESRTRLETFARETSARAGGSYVWDMEIGTRAERAGSNVSQAPAPPSNSWSNCPLAGQETPSSLGRRSPTPCKQRFCEELTSLPLTPPPYRPTPHRPSPPSPARSPSAPQHVRQRLRGESAEPPQAIQGNAARCPSTGDQRREILGGRGFVWTVSEPVVEGGERHEGIYVGRKLIPTPPLRSSPDMTTVPLVLSLTAASP